MPESMYCENKKCAVILYDIQIINGMPQENCPSCGQFGRTKGK